MLPPHSHTWQHKMVKRRSHLLYVALALISYWDHVIKPKKIFQALLLIPPPRTRAPFIHLGPMLISYPDAELHVFTSVYFHSPIKASNLSKELAISYKDSHDGGTPGDMFRVDSSQIWMNDSSFDQM